MSKAMAVPAAKIKKLHISETVLFAINNIPEVDQATLEKFLELVNTSGTFGEMSQDQITTKMRLTLRYIPNACPRSLLILADLLEISIAFLLDSRKSRSTVRLPASQLDPGQFTSRQVTMPAI